MKMPEIIPGMMVEFEGDNGKYIVSSYEDKYTYLTVVDIINNTHPIKPINKINSIYKLYCKSNEDSSFDEVQDFKFIKIWERENDAHDCIMLTNSKDILYLIETLQDICHSVGISDNEIIQKIINEM